MAEPRVLGSHWFQSNPLTQVAVGQINQLAGVRTRCRDNQGLGCDRIEVGTKMDRAFYHQYQLLGRFDTEMPHYRQIETLLAHAADSTL